MNNTFNIKFAGEEDTSLILSFIRELAEYEKLQHEVVATEEILKETLFGDKAYAEVIIAYLNEEAVGFSLFFHNFSTFLGKPGIYLEDLYVKPKARGNGIGKKMLSFLASLAIEKLVEIFLELDICQARHKSIICRAEKNNQN